MKFRNIPNSLKLEKHNKNNANDLFQNSVGFIIINTEYSAPFFCVLCARKVEEKLTPRSKFFVEKLGYLCVLAFIKPEGEIRYQPNKQHLIPS
jgi:hypothetical protein